MLRCLELAERGSGRVSPNPMVGAILMRGGKIIGEGYHRRFGGPHAEVEALRSATASPRGSTLYVNLEPCNYHGKTPPCTDQLLRAGIRRVVVGMRDPNPRVSGKGIAQLRRAGLKVDVGIAREECTRLNEAFAKYIRTRRPWVALKLAQTLDGKIAARVGRPVSITNATSRRFSHRLRSRFDAVLVGAGTVNADNPRLTVRAIRGRNPLRVVLDGNFTVREGARVFHDHAAGTILYIGRRAAKRSSAKKAALTRRGVRVVELPSGPGGRLSVSALLSHLGTLGIASLLVEGGAITCDAFLAAGAADKLYLIVAPTLYGTGTPGHASLAAVYRRHPIRDARWWSLEGDVVLEGYLT